MSKILTPLTDAMIQDEMRRRGFLLQHTGGNCTAYILEGGDQWDDATTPRTDRPVRFNAGYRLYAFAAPLGRTFAPSFTYRPQVD